MLVSDIIDKDVLLLLCIRMFLEDRRMFFEDRESIALSTSSYSNDSSFYMMLFVLVRKPEYFQF
jgi:hypothetical protein